MKAFINWGAESPEQLETRRRLDEEFREIAIRRFINEQRRAAESSFAAGSGQADSTYLDPDYVDPDYVF